MKDQFLKLAGVKSEKEFYKKFPTEEAFMAKYGKQVKKLQMGAMLQGSARPEMNVQPLSFQKLIDQNDMMITGSTQSIRQQKAQDQAMLAAQNKIANKKGIGDILGDVANIASTAAQFAGGAGGGAKNGKKLKKALFGDETMPMNKPKGNKTLETIGKYAGPAGQIYEGVQQMKDEKEIMNQALQMQGVSDVALQASMTRPEQVKRKYVRPEDNINTGGEFFPIYGAGTVVAKNGGEISNTFAPNTIYTDLEEAEDGGMFSNFKTNPDFMKLNKSGDQTAIYNFASQGGGDIISDLSQGIGNPKGYGTSGAGKIGGTVGGTAGFIIGGPVGKMVGQFAGQTIGDALDRKAERTEHAKGVTQSNIIKMAMNQGAQALQQQNYSYMKDGGFVNPQVATSLEGIPLTKLFAPDPYMDTLRAGGHLKSYTPPSERSMYTGREQFAMGGDLQTHWGGYAEPMSYNPYLPDGGETVMFKGQSHDESDGKGNTGIGITFGRNPVEVERGEPAVKLKNGSDGSSNLTVYGNLKIPKFGAAMMGDVKAADTKFKNYVADLSKMEQKQNKLMDKSVTALDELDTNTPYDMLSMSSYKSNMLGANMKLKDIADKKIKAASLQEAINNTAEEMGLSADDLAKGKVKQAKKGASIPKYQNSGDPIQYVKKSSTPGMLDYTPIGERDIPEYFKNAGDYEKQWVPFVNEVVKDDQSLDYIVNKLSNYSGQDAQDVANLFKGKTKEEQAKLIDKLGKDAKIGPVHDTLMQLYDLRARRKASEQETLPSAPDIFASPTLRGPTIPKRQAPVVGKEDDKFDWMTLANQVLPYVRPTDAESLDPRQLAGEMYALSTNQVEPVRAQTFQPQLSTPYDISLQDIVNKNQSDYRAAQRMMGYNPAAQAMLNAQKYQANQQVLGEQFRMNQAMKDQVYKENRGLLDQAKLQNLQILDQQYGRQQQALSNTKATTQAALNSIASKYAQNQLENRTLQTYENLYNYRFDPRFRAMNMNPLAQFDIQMASSTGSEDAVTTEIKRQVKERLDAAGMPAGKTITTETKQKPSSGRNGALVKAIKSM